MTSALDFGCGKLRYGRDLSAIATRIVFVDSEVQVSRHQRIEGRNTTVRHFVARMWKNAEVHALEQYKFGSATFDLILCANVLSAIPSPRARSRALRLLLASLAPGGVCLFVTQYRNTYFTHAQRRKNAVPHLDGWIARSGDRASYYGIIPKEKLTRLVKRHGFVVHAAWNRGESAFVVAGAPWPLAPRIVRDQRQAA